LQLLKYHSIAGDVCTILQFLKYHSIAGVKCLHPIAGVKCLHPIADMPIAIDKCLHPTAGPVQQPGAGARQGGEHAHHPFRHQATAVSFHQTEREKAGSRQVVISVSVGC
jgi:hypothetical protein